jgi:membrane AbrB-like protein
MAFSAVAHITGLTAAKPPAELVAAAQVVAGSAIGARFSGTRVAALMRLALYALAATLMMIAVALLFAGALSTLGLPLPDLILALAPGGLAEMSLVALALHADAAFVSTHHVARIAMVVAVAPAVRKLLPAGWRGEAGSAQAD